MTASTVEFSATPNGFSAETAPVGPELAAGELLLQKNRVLVGTGRGILELQEVQAAGKRRMNAADWARGGHSGSVLR